MLCDSTEDLWFVFFLLGFLIAQDASERAALLHPGVLSDGQFYSPPESVAGSYVHVVFFVLTLNSCIFPHLQRVRQGKGGAKKCVFRFKQKVYFTILK